MTHALSLNCEALLRLGPGADAAPQLATSTLEELRARVDRLLALWHLTSRVLGRHQVRQSARRMKALLELLPDEPSHGRVVQELLDHTDDRKQRAAVRQLMDEWHTLITPSNLNPGVARESVCRLLQRDSAAWRSAFMAVDVTNDTLIERGFARSYRRARRLSKNNVTRKPSLTRLCRWRRRVAQVAGQLELLEQYLSEPIKEGLWHLGRLDHVLQRRLQLLRFAAVLERNAEASVGGLAKVQGRVLKAVRARDKVLERRAHKLCDAGFRCKPKAFTRALRADSANIVSSLAL